MPIGSGQPVGLLVFAGRLRAGVERERAVGVLRERLVLCPERVALQVVRMEEVLVVVERKRPEAIDWRGLSLGKRHRIALRADEWLASRIVVGIKVLRLVRLVIEHVGARGASAVVVVHAPLRVVNRAVPAVAGGAAVVFPLEELLDDFLFGFLRGLYE